MALISHRLAIWLLGVVWLLTQTVTTTVAQEVESENDLAISIAVLPFEGEEANQVDRLITGLLTAQLSQQKDWIVLERRRMDAILDEMNLNVSGLVKQDATIRLGKLVGARVLVTGSILEVGESRYLIAKLIGTETSRVSGVSVKAEIDSPITDQVEKLTSLIAEEAEEKLDKLVDQSPSERSTITKLRKLLKKKQRKKEQLTVAIIADEKQLDGRKTDSAVRTELQRVLTDIGFSIEESDTTDFQIRARGISEFGVRQGSLISVSGRVEMELFADGKLILADQRSKIVFGASEAIAGKNALQLATSSLALNLLQRYFEKK